jgi:hypothetical protein
MASVMAIILRAVACRLVVGLEFAFDVAELAFHSERRRDELHGWEHLIGRRALQGLNVLESLLGGFTGWDRLGEDRYGESQGACHCGIRQGLQFGAHV